MRNLLQRIGVLLSLSLIVWLLGGCESAPTPPSPPRAPTLLATIPIKAFDVPARVAVNRHTNLVYITLSTHVAVFKETKQLATINTGHKWAVGIAIDEKKDWVYVTNTYSDTVSVIRGTELITNVATLGRDTAGVVVDPTSQRAYVLSSYPKREPNAPGLESSILILEGPKVVAHLKFGQIILTHIIADPVNGYIYAGGARGVVRVIKDAREVARFEGAPSYDAPASVRSMDVNLKTGEVYVLDGFNNIRKFKEEKLLDTIKLNEQRAGVFEFLHLHPSNGYFYLTKGSREVLVFKDDWQEIAKLPTGQVSVHTAIDPFTGNVYVANFYDGTVSVFNGVKPLGKLETDWHPARIGINPNNGMVYVVNTGDETISIFGYLPQNSTPATSISGYPPPNYTPPAPTAPTRAPTQRPYP
jgi:DNA-binding beta-propeller fold protein YncE